MPQARSDDPRSLAGPSFDALLDQFEEAWESVAAPSLEDYWTRVAGSLVSGPDRRRLLVELVKIDLHRRWPAALKQGGAARPTLESYAARFSDLGTARQLPADLIAEEYCARHSAGDRPGHDEYLRRFQAQAAELRKILPRMDVELTPAPLPSPSPTLPDSAAAPIHSVQDLIDCLTQLGLLTAKQMEQTARPEFRACFTDRDSLARFLRENGWLTPYQVEQLSLGRRNALAVGPYLLLERIGEGATSVVFRARHRHLQRVVALKVIRKEIMQDVGADVLDRIYQEFRAAGRLSHLHCVHAFDAGPVGATLFIAMEHVEGVNLLELVAQKGPLTAAQACDYVRQACSALHHAAASGIVHRDVKPSNLVVSGAPDGALSHPEGEPGGVSPRSPGHPWGLVKLLDLGLARIHHLSHSHSSGMLTHKGAIMGTADYMSPEQAVDAHAVDIRADLYSLGCTLYFLLAGRPPFVGGTFVEKVERHRTEQPVPVERLCPAVPPEVAAVVRRLLAKRPQDRYQTPAELFVALGGRPEALPPLPLFTLDDTSVMEGSTVSLPSIPSADAPLVFRRRWLLPACLGAVALLLIVVGFSIDWGSGRRRAAGPPPVVEQQVRELVLAIECGRKEGEVRLLKPNFSCTLLEGATWDHWRVEPPAKSYCWFHTNTLVFEVRVPPRTPGVLRLYFFDGDDKQRRQRLTVQGRRWGEMTDFSSSEKVVEIPMTASDTASGRIEVRVDNLSAANAVVSTVEFFERKTVHVSKGS